MAIRLIPLILLLTAPALPANAGMDGHWQRMPDEKFWQQPEVGARIDPTHFNRGLMAAAIFHASNRVRVQFQLRKFGHLGQLDDAADLQAYTGSLLPGVSHHNPLPGLGDVMDRARAAGLEPKMVAENIALTMTLDGDPKAIGFGDQVEGKGRRYYDPRSGRTLEQRTYADFAALVVQQWMDSPEHRANLLDANLKYLGCSARMRKSYSGADMLYSVQVFYTPDAK